MQNQVQNQPASIEDLFHKTREYLETRLELLRLKAIDKSSDLLSSVVVSVVIFLILILVLFCITIGLALWIGDLLGKSFYGFFIVAGFYCIVALLLYLLRDKWIKSPISNMIIDKVIK